MLVTNLLQVKSYVMVDHHNLFRDIAVAKIRVDTPIELKQKITEDFYILNKILIDFKSCECEYPNLEKVKDTTIEYENTLKRQRVNPWLLNEHEISDLNDKIATCQVLLHTCDVLDHNVIWKEHLIGGFALEDHNNEPPTKRIDTKPASELSGGVDQTTKQKVLTKNIP